jgi:hypothetical protein
MPAKAMILASDSQNPSAAEMPLYAFVLPNGQFQIIEPKDIEDTPCFKLTPEARREMHLASIREKPGAFVRDALKRREIDADWLDE